MAQNTLIVSNWKMNLNLINSTKLISKLKILKISKNIKNIVCPQYLLIPHIRDLIKIIVSSRTYKQKSLFGKEKNSIDPNNIYLSRASSHRLPAEMIRDNALALSGLLSKKVGGPSVKPYQPKGLWKEKNNFSLRLLEYKESKGEDLYRRGMYTFIKRGSPPPSLITFDATSREICTIKREKTSSPLQSLVLLNDTQFFEKPEFKDDAD